jgi:hypothetical protein
MPRVGILQEVCSSTDGDPRWSRSSRRLEETAEVDVEIVRHIDELCDQPLVSAVHMIVSM